MTERPKITAAETGPLIIKTPPDLSGLIAVELADHPKVALCRCGASANKPFCDAPMQRSGSTAHPITAACPSGALRVSIADQTAQPMTTGDIA